MTRFNQKPDTSLATAAKTEISIHSNLIELINAACASKKGTEEITLPEELPALVRRELKAALDIDNDKFRNTEYIIGNYLTGYTSSSIFSVVKALLLEIDIEKRIDNGEDPQQIFESLGIEPREITYDFFGYPNLAPAYGHDSRGVVIAPPNIEG